MKIIDRLKVNKEKIRVIYEGYERVSNYINKSDFVFKRFKIEKNKYFVFVGTIQPRKNLLTLIEAFSRANIDKNIKLVIIGKWGWSYEKEKEAPKMYGVEDRVIFTGYLDDDWRLTLVKNCIAYIQPSITEGFGLPILEAMDLKVPVISSNGGALEEVVGDSGLLFSPYETEKLAGYIESLIGNKNLKDRLVNRVNRRLKVFGWEKAAKETLDYLTYSK